jgi:protein phosphatase
MVFRFGAVTDRGRVRQNNEDRFIAESDLGFFAVVDGMGGHASGELASATIAEAMTAFVRDSAGDSDKTWPLGLDPKLSMLANRLRIAVHIANRTLATRAQANAALDGSGATLAAVLCDRSEMAISNVGDCRGYLIRDGEISQVTRDHSVVAEQLALGLIDQEAVRSHPLRHVVTRAVSGQPGMTVDVFELTLHPRERVLLCSDGIHAVLTDNEIAALFGDQNRPLQELCEEAIQQTNQRGGPDNATVVVIEASE